MPGENKPTSSKQNMDHKSGSSIPLTVDRELAGDPSYKELILKYQNGDTEECALILKELLVKYPDSKWLQDFQSDLDVQETLRRMGAQDKAKRRKQTVMAVIRNFIFLIILAFVGYFLVTQILNSYQATQQQSSEVAQQLKADNLKTMEDQAWALLQAGKPELALTIAQNIESMDPNYPTLGQIREDANKQLALIGVYDHSVELMDQGNYEDALPLLQEIADQFPVFRDVRARIEVINQYYHVQELLSIAATSFEAKNWSAVITNYEEALELDPGVSTENVKQELLISYLRSVIDTLNQDEPTIEEIQKAEKFYQKALALVPQSKTYSAEREQLQNLSVQLLSTKYYQLGREILADPKHTEKMVSSAVDYLNRALALNPYEPKIVTEADRAQTYLSALQNFDASNWDQAVEQLTKLSNVDPDYPNGLGVQMLYEAYRARGLRYYYGGFYLDARKNFEAAEILAYESPENKLRLLEIQIDIGNTLGKLDDYMNAASYYKYALDQVKAEELGAQDRTFVADLKAAASLFEQTKYLESYTQYKAAIEKISFLYSDEEIYVNGGESLVYLASTYNSTIQAIRTRNELDNIPSLRYAQTLNIPVIP